MNKPNLNKIIASALDKDKFQSKNSPALPINGWLNQYKSGGLTPNKAREILHDKSVHGHPLTEAQRRFFGAMSKGNTMKYKTGGVSSPQVCYDPETGKEVPCAKGAHRTLIFTENPDIKNLRGNNYKTILNEINLGEFTEEANDLKNYLIKNQPGEDIEIYPSYTSPEDDRVITTLKNGKLTPINEVLRTSTPNTRLAFMAHHGDNLFGQPYSKLGKKLQATDYDNCYLGSCFSGDIAASDEFKGLTNFHFRPGYGYGEDNEEDMKKYFKNPGLKWFGVNPNKNSQKGEAGVNSAFYNTSSDLASEVKINKAIDDIYDQKYKIIEKYKNSKFPIDDKRNPGNKEYTDIQNKLLRAVTQLNSTHKSTITNPRKGLEYDINNSSDKPHIGKGSTLYFEDLYNDNPVKYNRLDNWQNIKKPVKGVDYKMGGGYFPKYHSWAPPRMDDGGLTTETTTLPVLNKEITYTHEPGKRGAYRLKRTVTPYTSNRNIRRFTQAPTDPRQVNFLQNYAGAINGYQDDPNFVYPTQVPFEGDKHWNIDRFIIDPQFTTRNRLHTGESSLEQNRANVLADMYKYYMLQNPKHKRKAFRKAKRFVRNEVDPRIKGPFLQNYNNYNEEDITFQGWQGLTSFADQNKLKDLYWNQAIGQGTVTPEQINKLKNISIDYFKNYKKMSEEDANKQWKAWEDEASKFYNDPANNPANYSDIKYKNGGDISIPNLDADNWLLKYDEGGLTTDITTNPPIYTSDPNDYQRWMDSTKNYNKSMAHLAASKKAVKKNIDNFSLFSKEGLASAVGNFFDTDVKQIRPKYSEIDVPKSQWYNSNSNEEQPTRVVGIGDFKYSGAYTFPGSKNTMYDKQKFFNDKWGDTYEYADLYNDIIPIYPPTKRQNLQLVKPNSKNKINVLKSELTRVVDKVKKESSPILKRKVENLQPIVITRNQTIRGVKPLNMSTVDVPPIQRGTYNVSYFDPTEGTDVQGGWQSRRFETEKEAQDYMDTRRNENKFYGPHMTLTRKFENGGWLTQYAPGGITTDTTTLNPQVAAILNMKMAPPASESTSRVINLPYGQFSTATDGYNIKDKTDAEKAINRQNQAVKRAEEENYRLLVNAGMDEKAARNQSRSGVKMLASTKKMLDTQKQLEYRVKMTPGYDPSKPIKDQYSLAYKNNLDTRVERGKNMVMNQDLGNPIFNVARTIMYAPGESAINVSHPYRSYIQPGWKQGLTNLAVDAFTLFPELPIKGAQTIGRIEQSVPKVYNKIATGESFIPYAWKSPAVGLSEEASQNMFKGVLNSGKLTDAERAVIADYQYNSKLFTGRNGNVDPVKRKAINDIIKKYNINVGNDAIATRMFNPENNSLGATLENGRLNFGDRPTSFTVGAKGSYGSGATDRLVIPNRYLKGMGDKFVKNTYEPLSEEALKLVPEDFRSWAAEIGVDNAMLGRERELIGSGLDFRRIGKVKNDVGGYDWIVKPRGSKQITKPVFNEPKQVFDLENIPEEIGGYTGDVPEITSQQYKESLKNNPSKKYRYVNPDLSPAARLKLFLEHGDPQRRSIFQLKEADADLKQYFPEWDVPGSSDYNYIKKTGMNLFDLSHINKPGGRMNFLPNADDFRLQDWQGVKGGESLKNFEEIYGKRKYYNPKKFTARKAWSLGISPNKYGGEINWLNRYK